MPRGEALPRLKKGERIPGSGRKPGTPNKITQDVREMIIGALRAVGGEQYLAEQARKNPQAFMALIGKVIPKEVDATIRGPEGMNLFPSRIEIVDGRKSDD